MQEKRQWGLRSREEESQIHRWDTHHAYGVSPSAEPRESSGMGAQHCAVCWYDSWVHDVWPISLALQRG